mgnify:CR=1 FL=1
MNNSTSIHPDQWCIPLECDHDGRISAENHKSLFHYCKLSDLENILRSSAIKLNNLINIGKNSEYERKNVDQDFWGLIFVACFALNEKSRALWNDFADNHYGVCIQFVYRNSFFEEVINKEKTAIGYSMADKKICEIGYNLSSVKMPKPTCIPNVNTDIILDIKLTDVSYTNTPQSSTVYIENGKMANISNIAQCVPTGFSHEMETRAIGVLRATHDVELSQIDYILLPIRLTNIKLIFGKKVCMTDRKKYSDMLHTKTILNK